METMFVQNFGGTNKEYYGFLKVAYCRAMLIVQGIELLFLLRT